MSISALKFPLSVSTFHFRLQAPGIKSAPSLSPPSFIPVLLVLSLAHSCLLFPSNAVSTCFSITLCWVYGYRDVISVFQLLLTLISKLCASVSLPLDAWMSGCFSVLSVCCLIKFLQTVFDFIVLGIMVPWCSSLCSVLCSIWFSKRMTLITLLQASDCLGVSKSRSAPFPSVLTIQDCL
jgi:hypothetical protein